LDERPECATESGKNPAGRVAARAVKACGGAGTTSSRRIGRLLGTCSERREALQNRSLRGIAMHRDVKTIEPSSDYRIYVGVKGGSHGYFFTSGRTSTRACSASCGKCAISTALAAHRWLPPGLTGRISRGRRSYSKWLPLRRLWWQKALARTSHPDRTAAAARALPVQMDQEVS